MCMVSPVQRTKVPAPEIAPEVPQIMIIDLEISVSLKQRRQAHREGNHPSHEMYQVIIRRAQNRGLSTDEISDAETITLVSESETEPMSE